MLSIASFYFLARRHYLTVLLSIYLIASALTLRKFIFSAAPISSDYFPEWDSSFLYLADIVFVVLFFATIRRIIHQLNHWCWYSFLILHILLIHTISSYDPLRSFLSVLGLFQAFYLFLVIRLYRQLLRPLFLTFLGIGLLSAIIGITQFILNHSLGLVILRESTISPELINVAKVLYQGSMHIRSYGLFQHPNILAFISSFSIVISALLLRRSSKPLIYAYLLPIFIASTVLSFSRVGIAILTISLSFFIINLWHFVPRGIFVRFLVVLGIFLSILIIFFYQPYMSRPFEEVEDFGSLDSFRLQTINQATTVIRNNLLFGVGFGNYMVNLRQYFPFLAFWQYQPPHSIFILTLAETGIFAIIPFILLFVYLKKTFHVERLIVIALAIVFGLPALFDHYLITTRIGIISISVGILCLLFVRTYPLKQDVHSFEQPSTKVR